MSGAMSPAPWRTRRSTSGSSTLLIDAQGSTVAVVRNSEDAEAIAATTKAPRASDAVSLTGDALRAAIREALFAGPHWVEADNVNLKRNPDVTGNAASQILDRLCAAAIAGGSGK